MKRFEIYKNTKHGIKYTYKTESQLDLFFYSIEWSNTQ